MVAVRKTTRIFFALLWIAITIMEWQWIHDSNMLLSMNFISWLVIVNLVFQTFTLKWCKIPIVSFFYAFIFFYYIFHFGQVFILGLFPNYKLDYLNYVEAYMTDTNTFVATVELCIVSINAFFVGGLFAKNGIVFNKPLDANTFAKIIKKIFILLLPFRLLIDSVQLFAALFFGYYGAIEATNMIPGVIASIGNMWYALVPLYYLTLKTPKQIRNYLILIITYMGITMLTGNRGHQIVCLASLMIVMLTTLNKIKAITILKYSLITLVGMFFVDIIYSMRENSISEFLSNPSAFMESTGDSNIVLETIGTFGETIYTPYLTIVGNGSEYQTWFGEAFVKSLVGIVPDLFGWFKTINKEAIFPKNLGTKSAIGGSFSGEMYYNFGVFYSFMSALFGCIYCYLSNKIYLNIKYKNYMHSVMPIVICSLALWWVRDSIGNLTRQIVWMYFLLIFLQLKTKRI